MKETATSLNCTLIQFKGTFRAVAGWKHGGFLAYTVIRGLESVIEGLV